MATSNRHSAMACAVPGEGAPLPLDAAGMEQVRRRADLLLQCAHALQRELDGDAVVTCLASRVQELFAVDLVAVLLRRGDRFVVQALAIADAAQHTAVHEAHERGELEFLHELALNAQLAGEPVSMSVTSLYAHPPMVSAPGLVLAAPLRSPEQSGALVLYRAGVRPFDAEERSTLAAVCGLGALAIANADLYARAEERNRELRQLLDLTSDLAAIGNLTAFLEHFVLRATEFLRFERSFLAVRAGDSFDIRCACDQGNVRAMSLPLPASVAQRLLASAEPVWCNDAHQWPAVELASLPWPNIRQLLCLPLLGPDGATLAVLGLIDRKEPGDIEAEDVRRARTLAAEASVALSAAHALHESSEHRRRSEILMNVALELNSSLRLSDFAASFTRRAAQTLACRAAALAVFQEKRFEVVSLWDPAQSYEPNARYALGAVLTEAVALHPDPLLSGPAQELLGAGCASTLGWNEVVLARMTAPDGALIGCLCLVDPPPAFPADDRKLLEALVAHAAVALDNARLFTRMDQANRHWIEIFDAITDLIVVHDENLRVLRVNRSLADFIGVSPSELIGVSMRAMIAMAADHTSEACPFCRVVSGGDEYLHPVLDRTYLVSTSRVHGAASEGMQTIHVLKDITDRREAERRYRELFDTIQEGLFFSTPEGRFIEVNEALVRMLGYDSREDLLAVDITHQIYVSPEERAQFRAELHERGMIRNYQETLRRRDGSLIYTLQNAFAVRDAQGNVVQYRGLILDITELKTFQAELQRQRDFNSKILDNTQSMIMVVDTAGLISYGNRRCFEVGGYTETDLLGRKLIELAPSPRRSALAESLEETLAGNQVDNLELPILLGQGRSGQFSLNLSPMRDEGGNVNSIVVVMTDISDAAMLQAKLMHTEKLAAVGQLVSGVAHEVNNPLTAVLGFTDLLLDNPEVPERAKDDLRVVLQEAQRTKQIVQNLLSFARQTPPERQPVQVNLVLRRTLALRAYDFANHGIQIVERMEDSVPEIMADAHQLQQVFLNILNNAYDAVQENDRPGRIEIATCAHNGWAEVIFRDNGHGIAYPERIFDPFFTTKEVGKGTGLGLSICYGIVREHGGEILCRNNGDTPGATFTVRLPIAAARRPRAAAHGAGA